MASLAWGEGHGPIFALATPTLGEDNWSSDTFLTTMSTTAGTNYMLGHMFGYGIRRDLDVNVAWASPMWREQRPMTRARPGSMMDSQGGELEWTLRWRFHRKAPEIGTRRESTLLFGGTVPYQEELGGMKRGPSLNLAAATGYASRSWYWWLAGGYQRYFERSGDRAGDLPYLTGTIAYRPAYFRQEAEADWRVFFETAAEFPQRGRMDGSTARDTGGERVMAGASVLGLYGAWGVSVGVMVPVHERLNGDQPSTKYRARAGITYWF